MKKGQPITECVQKITGDHPRRDLRLISILDDIDDPRDASGNFKHPLTTILFMTIVCSLCGANNWETIKFQSGSMIDWLTNFVDVSQGIPCTRTFKRVFSVLDPARLEKILIEVMDLVREKRGRDIISFDGKCLRGTRDSGKGVKAIHILNAWSKESGICIGHTQVSDKSNENTALPGLIDLLDLKGAVITADALNTQKKIAKKAIEADADYILPVKGNHASLREDIELLFKDAQENGFRGFDADYYETVEKSHGRVERRKYYCLDAEGLPCQNDWEGFQSIGVVSRERKMNGKINNEVQYYISSCEIDAKLFERATRGHWGIENSLHWVLDVTFREDHNRYRDRVGAQNLATIRKLALGVLAKDNTFKCGKEGKRLIAATDARYREKMLRNFF